MDMFWVRVGAGRLAIGHRPKAKALRLLADSGCTHLVTLLGEREGAVELGAHARAAGIEWLWLPLENGEPLPNRRDVEVAAIFQQIASALERGGAVLIHCSAGIHRTGMITYALLRRLGYDAERATAIIREMRAVTADGVGARRIEWGERFIARFDARLRDPPRPDISDV